MLYGFLDTFFAVWSIQFLLSFLTIVFIVIVILVTVSKWRKNMRSGGGKTVYSDNETENLCRILNGEELYLRACALVDKDGNKTDYTRWKSFMSAAAQKGHIPALREWGAFNKNDNNALAVNMLSFAAEAGDEKAAEELFAFYYYGSRRGTPEIARDREKAYAIIKPFADKGGAVSCRLAGNYYYFEKNDNKKALEWYLKAAEGGDAEAMCQAADIYNYQDDFDSQKKWLLKAAERDYAEAESSLAVLFECSDPPDYAQAIEWYGRAYSHGETTAACSVGEIYLEGKGVGKDENQAFEWFKKAQEAGSVYGEYLLGRCYMEGAGVRQDKAKGIKLYASAARYDADAQYALGLCYLEGNGVKTDVKKGISYLEQAAEDNGEAQNKLAEIYYAGELVKKNEKRAEELWRSAAKKGNSDAKECMKIYFGESVN